MRVQNPVTLADLRAESLARYIPNLNDISVGATTIASDACCSRWILPVLELYRSAQMPVAPYEYCQCWRYTDRLRCLLLHMNTVSVGAIQISSDACCSIWILSLLELYRSPQMPVAPYEYCQCWRYTDRLRCLLLHMNTASVGAIQISSDACCSIWILQVLELYRSPQMPVAPHEYCQCWSYTEKLRRLLFHMNSQHNEVQFSDSNKAGCYGNEGQKYQ
jgi:hypothetical protein